MSNYVFNNINIKVFKLIITFYFKLTGKFPTMITPKQLIEPIIKVISLSFDFSPK